MSEHNHGDNDPLTHLIPDHVVFSLIFPQQGAQFVVVLKSILGFDSGAMIEVL
jgi:hypothetical protein